MDVGCVLDGAGKDMGLCLPPAGFPHALASAGTKVHRSLVLVSRSFFMVSSRPSMMPEARYRSHLAAETLMSGAGGGAIILPSGAGAFAAAAALAAGFFAGAFPCTA